MKMKEVLKKTIVEAINSRRLDNIDVRSLELCVIPYDDIPAVSLNVYTSYYHGELTEPEKLVFDGLPFGWGDTYEIMEQWAMETGFTNHVLKDDEHYEQVDKLYNEIEILLREIVNEIHEEKNIVKIFEEEIPIEIRIGALGEPGFESIFYNIKIYKGKKMYLEGKYIENILLSESEMWLKSEMQLISKNEDRLIDTIFDGDFSSARIMEFLKTRVRPDIRTDDSAVLRELMRTGGKMYDDDISIAIRYDGV